MPARLKATDTSASHLGVAQLGRLRDLVLEERSLQLLRQHDLTISPGFEPDVTAALLNACEETLIDLEGPWPSSTGTSTAHVRTAVLRSPSRLEAVRGARFCVPCQARWEHLSR